MVPFTRATVRGRGPAWHVAAARQARLRCDVYLSTQSYLTPLLLRVPTVLVVLDLVAFDRRWRPQSRAAAIERAALRGAVSRAERIVAISESTRADLVARLPRTSARVDVVVPGAGNAFSPTPGPGDGEVLRRHGIDGRYVLAVGTLEPRKNLPRLIEAFASVGADVELVLVGATGWKAGPTLAAAERDPRVRRLGHVPEADLPALYRGADALCYPSLYEGYGLPVLEALRCGTPVVTSNRSSLPEAGRASRGSSTPRTYRRSPRHSTRCCQMLLCAPSSDGGARRPPPNEPGR